MSWRWTTTVPGKWQLSLYFPLYSNLFINFILTTEFLFPSGWTTVWAFPTTSSSCFSSPTPCCTVYSLQHQSFSISSNSGWWVSVKIIAYARHLIVESYDEFELHIVSAVAIPQQQRTGASVMSCTFLKPTILSSFCLSCFSLPGGLAKWARKVPCTLPHVCGAHVLRQSHVPLWLSLLVGGQKQIHFRWGLTNLSENPFVLVIKLLSHYLNAMNYLLGGALVIWMRVLCKSRRDELNHKDILLFFLFSEAFSAPVFVTGPDRNGFNVGIRRNLQQVFGEDRRLWFIPVFTRWVWCHQQVKMHNLLILLLLPIFQQCCSFCICNVFDLW